MKITPDLANVKACFIIRHGMISTRVLHALNSLE